MSLKKSAMPSLVLPRGKGKTLLKKLVPKTYLKTGIWESILSVKKLG